MPQKQKFLIVKPEASRNMRRRRPCFNTSLSRTSRSIKRRTSIYSNGPARSVWGQGADGGVAAPGGAQRNVGSQCSNSRGLPACQFPFKV